jgi:hypothetical protein
MTIKTIKKTLNAKDNNNQKRGWVVYYENDKIIEVKSLFDPKKYNGSRKVYTDTEIIRLLETYKKKNK